MSFLHPRLTRPTKESGKAVRKGDAKKDGKNCLLNAVAKKPAPAPTMKVSLAAAVKKPGMKKRLAKKSGSKIVRKAEEKRPPGRPKGSGKGRKPKPPTEFQLANQAGKSALIQALQSTAASLRGHSQNALAAAKPQTAILINPTAEVKEDGTLVTSYGVGGKRTHTYKKDIVSQQHEVLWKYKRSVKDPIKRLKLTAEEGVVQRQVVRVNPVACSEPGVSFVSRGNRISQKIWVVGFRDAQRRKRNRWINCREFVSLEDPVEEREERARKRAMCCAVNWLRNHRSRMCAMGLLQPFKVVYEGKRESGMAGVRWFHMPHHEEKKHRVGWMSAIASVKFTGRLKSGKAARPVTRSFTLDRRDYADDEKLEAAIERLRLAAIAQRKKWEKEVFVYEEASYPTYTCKLPEKLSLQAHNILAIAEKADNSL